MGTNEQTTTGEHSHTESAAELIRQLAASQREIADEWARLSADDITAAGFANLRKQVCLLLRTNSAVLENCVSIIESGSRHVGCHSQCDHQTGDRAIGS